MATENLCKTTFTVEVHEIWMELKGVRAHRRFSNALLGEKAKACLSHLRLPLRERASSPYHILEEVCYLDTILKQRHNYKNNKQIDTIIQFSLEHGNLSDLLQR